MVIGMPGKRRKRTMKHPTRLILLATLLCIAVAAQDSSIIPPVVNTDATSSATTAAAAAASSSFMSDASTEVDELDEEDEADEIDDADDADETDEADELSSSQSRSQVPGSVGHHSFLRQPSPLPTDHLQEDIPVVERNSYREHFAAETAAAAEKVPRAEPPEARDDPNGTDAEYAAATNDHDPSTDTRQSISDPAGTADTGYHTEEEQLPRMLLQRGGSLDAVTEDDRTLLDVFGEVAKEYLTQHVIPDTDADCVWDWRSIRCEPACECKLDPQWGDYHLGRSCRYRPVDDDMNENERDSCVYTDPATLWRERPATRRIVSLVTQTSQIIRDRSKRLAENARNESLERLHKMQTNICSDLWIMTSSQHECLPADAIPIKTIPERILCGPVEFLACDDDDDSDEMLKEANVRRANKETPMARRAWSEL